ncbi:MAG: AAA family ATPase [Solirubrobacteraceae bacterium]
MSAPERIDTLRAQLDAEIDERAASLPKLIALDDFEVRPNVTWLIRDLLPAQSIAVVFGAPKSGKTYTTMDLATHAAHGMHWHGHTVSRALRVAYLAGEGHAGLRVRLHAWRRHHEAELRGDMRVMAEALSLTGRIEDLLDVLRPYTPDVLIADTLNAYFGDGDENSTKDMTAFVAAVRRLRDELHCSIIIIHHTGHAEAARERGSSVLRGAADVIIQVARDDGGSGLIGFQVILGRDMDAWDEPLSLRLRSVDTDWADDEGQPISSCIVEAGEAPVTLPGQGGRALSVSQRVTIQAVEELAAAHANGSHETLIARPDIIARARELGASRTAAYRAIPQLAGRQGWRLVEPGGLMVGRSP